MKELRHLLHMTFLGLGGFRFRAAARNRTISLAALWQSWVVNPTSGRETEMGGTPKGNADSSLDAAPKVLEFLKRSLSAP